MSSLLAKIESIFTGPIAEKAGTFVVHLGESVLKVEATTTLGAAILNAIKAGEAGTSAAQKIGLGIEALAPTILSLVATGGLSAAAEDVETVARVAIESALAQLEETGPVAIIEALAKVV